MPPRLSEGERVAHLPGKRIDDTVRTVDADPLHSKHPHVPASTDYGLGSTSLCDLTTVLQCPDLILHRAAFI